MIHIQSHILNKSTVLRYHRMYVRNTYTYKQRKLIVIISLCNIAVSKTYMELI